MKAHNQWKQISAVRPGAFFKSHCYHGIGWSAKYEIATEVLDLTWKISALSEKIGSLHSFLDRERHEVFLFLSNRTLPKAMSYANMSVFFHAYSDIVKTLPLLPYKPRKNTQKWQDLAAQCFEKTCLLFLMLHHCWSFITGLYGDFSMSHSKEFLSQKSATSFAFVMSSCAFFSQRNNNQMNLFFGKGQGWQTCFWIPLRQIWKVLLP